MASISSTGHCCWWRKSEAGLARLLEHSMEGSKIQDKEADADLCGEAALEWLYSLVDYDNQKESILLLVLRLLG
ncbi:hypothetical protein TorRG33x02_062420 [Trema orientale]|uniref:Uncharacterized protein n=1 Tax=Trema orientale TaxID=63057 RepID=A0A2P5FJG9_TREOI|nr:hypothetical protein TorRG33x02_062420 [Trema orientale]